MVKSVVLSFAMLVACTSALAQEVQPEAVQAFATSSAISARVPRTSVSVRYNFTLCDLNLATRSRRRKAIGGLIAIGGIGVAMLGVRPGQGSSFTYPLAGAAIVGVGGYMRYYANGYDAVWSSTMSAVQVGKTTRSELTDCLGRPSSTVTGSTGDSSTWIASKPGAFGGGSYKMATVSFRSNVVTGVKGADARQ
jgi:hypothetical protein